MARGLENPILNSPYDAPGEHFEIEAGVGPTGNVLPGRRQSESFIPIPLARKGKAAQAKLAFDGAERREKILLNGRKANSRQDPFVESNEQIVSRVLRDLSGRGGGKAGAIVVFNDEAHHCYKDKPLEDIELDAETKREANERNESARRWFKGIRAVQRKVAVKAIYDLSATPFYLSGSGYNGGFIFPWVVSDFALMDAIESGIVKVPRVPVDDDATNTLETVARERRRARWPNRQHVGRNSRQPAR